MLSILHYTPSPLISAEDRSSSKFHKSRYACVYCALAPHVVYIPTRLREGRDGLLPQTVNFFSTLTAARYISIAPAERYIHIQEGGERRRRRKKRRKKERKKRLSVPRAHERASDHMVAGGGLLFF